MRNRSAVAAVVVLCVLASPALDAQAPVLSTPDTPRIELTARRSTVLATDFDIVRMAITDPTVADAVVVAPREVLIDGKSSGTVSLILWGDGRRTQYDVVVAAGVSLLQQQLQALFPGEDINVSESKGAVVLSGRVSNNNVMLRAAEIARASAGTGVINMLQLPAGIDSQQVMLQVRVAEVNRRALTELGASFFTGAAGINDTMGRVTTQQFSAPSLEQFQLDEAGANTARLTFSDFLNLFIFNTAHDVGALVRALQAKGMFQSLAEPNLIAYNGQEASFLAGGEFPIPVVQGATGAVSVQFREFGVRLTFLPTIAGDVIHLHIRPEVSTLNFNAGISVSGFRIPALTTRRAETDVELRDGQSFAIAGLLDNTAQEDSSKFPILGDIPIIGTFFKSRSTRAERTELMVVVTPRLVRPLNPDEVPPLPTLPELFLPPVTSSNPAPAQPAAR